MHVRSDRVIADHPHLWLRHDLDAAIAFVAKHAGISGPSDRDAESAKGAATLINVQSLDIRASMENHPALNQGDNCAHASGTRSSSNLPRERRARWNGSGVGRHGRHEPLHGICAQASSTPRALSFAAPFDCRPHCSAARPPVGRTRPLARRAPTLRISYSALHAGRCMECTAAERAAYEWRRVCTVDRARELSWMGARH